MITNKECVPIAIVSSVPVYSGESKDGLIKSEYWSVVVDFAGGGVPEMFVWGGHVHESRPVYKTEKLYSGRYPIVTRVEYRFPHGVLRNTYKNVCRFTYGIEAQATQEALKSRLLPLNIDQRGYVSYPYGQDGYVAVWKMVVRFKGDIRSLFNQSVVEQNILTPRGGECIKRKYDVNNDQTSMTYEFQDTVFGIGQFRAKRFEKQLEALRNKNKQLVALNQVGPVR